MTSLFRIANIAFLRSFDILKRMDLTYRFTDMYRQEQKLLKTLHSFTHSVIMSRQQELALANEKATQNFGDADGIGIKKKTAFLDLLLQASVDGQPLSNEDIREEVDTFMFEVRPSMALRNFKLL